MEKPPARTGGPKVLCDKDVTVTPANHDARRIRPVNGCPRNWPGPSGQRNPAPYRLRAALTYAGRYALFTPG
jgi:hypothetical protein